MVKLPGLGESSIANSAPAPRARPGASGGLDAGAWGSCSGRLPAVVRSPNGGGRLGFDGNEASVDEGPRQASPTIEMFASNSLLRWGDWAKSATSKSRNSADVGG